MTFSADQLDVIEELVNIGIGRAASALSDMVTKRVHLEVPRVRIVENDDLIESIGQVASCKMLMVEQGFTGAFDGSAALMLPEEDSNKMVSLLLTGDDEALDLAEIEAEREAVITEVGNILINGLMGSFGNILDQPVDYHLPVCNDGELKEMLIHWDARAEALLTADVHFKVADALIEGGSC